MKHEIHLIKQDTFLEPTDVTTSLNKRLFSTEHALYERACPYINSWHDQPATGSGVGRSCQMIILEMSSRTFSHLLEVPSIEGKEEKGARSFEYASI